MGDISNRLRSGKPITIASIAFPEAVTTAPGTLASDHTVAINDGIAYCIYCDTAGEILKIKLLDGSDYTTPPLQAGYNPRICTYIYSTSNGSTIAGNIEVGAW